MPTINGVPMIFPTLISIAILLIVLGFGIPMIRPSKRYGHNSKKIAKGTIKFAQTNNPLKPLLRLGNKLTKPKKGSVTLTDQPISFEEKREKLRPKAKDSKYDIISLRGLGDTVYVIYDQSCTVAGKEYRLGDYHGEEWVHFKVAPYLNKDGSYSIILKDPYLPSSEKVRNSIKPQLVQ